ncbi:unnamed protein product [Kuraishia capsulata CBS 1993]|uniref:Uncharacterized protein n=1 Tax=Kuraishia capsulata CBS 1993 TaxID=1382522 RepID=W6MNA7_9ASCO|nr:uncharacterized protein KUCA_T00004072001 [Kuraishia capsulata CBS 1993]CDK28091.1 unnamed protein product [Kuraishia capsulata CBS 1993]
MRSLRRILSPSSDIEERHARGRNDGAKSPNRVSSFLNSFRKTPSPGLSGDHATHRGLSRRSTLKSHEDHEVSEEAPIKTPVPVALNRLSLAAGSDDDNEAEESHQTNNDSVSDGDPENYDALQGDADLSKTMSRQYASSLIGGSSVVHVDDEAIESDEETEIPTELKKVESLKAPENAEEHKIFSFAMPFGGNLSSGIQLPSLRFPFSDSNDDDNALKDVIKDKLRRQESISSFEEKFLFKEVKFGTDPSRFDAIKRAVLPVSLRHEIKHFLSDTERPRYETVFDEIAGDVLILGGYRGSILRDNFTKRRVWVPVVKAGLNLKKINLLVGPSDEDELRAHETVYADGILSHVGPIDISRRLMKKLDNGKVTLHDFGYDWRLSCDLNGEKLYKTLKNINRKNGNKGVLVIGHSMGGLVAHYAMQKDPTLIRGLVYVGVPFECPNVLGPIRWGDNVLFSTKVLTAEANFFFRSSFVFLPEDGRIFTDKATGKRIDLDFYDPDVWVEYNLSPLVSQKRKDAMVKRKSGEESAQSHSTKSTLVRGLTSPIQPSFEKVKSLEIINSIPLVHGMNSNSNSNDTVLPDVDENFHATFEESYDYLSRTLERTRKFHQFLKHDSSKKYPPLALVYSYSVPSVRESLVDGVKRLKEGDFFHFAYGPGDGVIHQKWLMPEPYGFSLVGKHSSTYGHVSLMSDLKAMGQALISIVDAEKN